MNNKFLYNYPKKDNALEVESHSHLNLKWLKRDKEIIVLLSQ